MRFVFLFILLLPFVEIWSLIEVGSRIGVMSTIGLLVLSGVVGMQLLKWQGVSTLLRINEKLAAGEMPAKEVVNGVLLAMAGVLLIIPGFITDVIALICWFPLTRYLIRHVLVKQIMAHPGFMQFNMMSSQAKGFSSDVNDKNQASNIYEGEFRDIKDENRRLPPGQ